MSTLDTTASAYFPRPDASSSVAQGVLVAAAAVMTAMMWLSAFGAGNAPRGYMADMMASAPQRITLPRVEVVGRTLAFAGDGEAVGCAVERTAHKPG